MGCFMFKIEKSRENEYFMYIKDNKSLIKLDLDENNITELKNALANITPNNEEQKATRPPKKMSNNKASSSLNDVKSSVIESTSISNNSQSVSASLNKHTQNDDADLIKKLFKEKDLDKEESEKVNFTREESIAAITNLMAMENKYTQLWISQIHFKELILAIKYTRHLKLTNFETKIFKNLSMRAAPQLKEDLDMVGKCHIDECRDALKIIYDVAIDLARVGKIILGSNKKFLVN